MAQGLDARSWPPSVDEVVVTATRVAEPADRVPADIALLRGEDLRARQANDLRTALAGVSGVEAPPGGDAGPASAVPSFWGLHEFDAFLLVVDGVPWGGAFNPSITTLDLGNVERIEVLKGSAPVVYGATSFVGVIQVIHYPAGQAADQAQLGYGAYDSWRADIATALPALGPLQQSVSFAARRDGFADSRERIEDARARYRASIPAFGGTLGLDADATVLSTRPPSPVPRIDEALAKAVPLDANYNPADARVDENHARTTLSYVVGSGPWKWTTTASVSGSEIRDVRGFLRTDLVNADSQNQRRHIQDDYFETNLDLEVLGEGELTLGADVLYGRATQSSLNGGYFPDLLGRTTPPPTTALHVDEANSLYDRRIFAGQFAQFDWKPNPDWDFNAGVRLNETSEHKRSTHLDGFDSTANTFDDRKRDATRVSGMVGVSYVAWRDGRDELVAYGDYRDTFKPAALDFGPDNTPDILRPETARSYEIGLKGRLADGRLTYEASAFLLNFKDLVVLTADASGSEAFQNAGAERLKGIEAEAQWRVTRDLTFSAAASWHDARFTRFLAVQGDGTIDAAGSQLPLAPRWLASLGVIYAPPQGVFGYLTLNYVGRRELDLANTAPARAYTMIDAGLGYGWGRYRISVNAYNLGDERVPVTASEFGDQSYYLSAPRKVFVDLTARF